MGLPLALSLTYLVYLSAVVIGSERRTHRVQHGRCSYTFLLPEVDHCSPLKDFQVTNSLQRDSPPAPDPGPGQPEGGGGQPRPSWHQRKLEVLESATENNTLWLQKVRYLRGWAKGRRVFVLVFVSLVPLCIWWCVCLVYVFGVFVCVLANNYFLFFLPSTNHVPHA